MLHEHRYLNCEPFTIAAMGIAAAGAGVSIAGQTQQNSAAKTVEDQKAKAVDNQITESRRRATQDFIMSVQDEQRIQAQEHQRLAEEEFDMSRKERHAVGQATVAAAEAGVAGQSLEAIKSDYRFQMDQAAGRLGINQSNADYQHQRNIQAHEQVYYNRATAIQPYQKQPVKPVDYFGPIFAAGGQILNTGIATGSFTGSEAITNPFAPLPPVPPAR